MRVLVAEDERRIADDIALSLRASGYAVDIVSDGEEAWFRGGTEEYDAAVLDIGLPKLDGLTLLKRWRAEGRAFPVLVLTARGAWTERVEGINAGADDYLPKPFEMEELLARLRAVIRRSAGQAGPVLTAGTLSLDTRQMRVTLSGVPVQLSPLDGCWLINASRRSRRSSTELAEHLYSLDHDRDTNAIEVVVARLRRKLREDIIKTRRGFYIRSTDRRD